MEKRYPLTGSGIKKESHSGKRRKRESQKCNSGKRKESLKSVTFEGTPFSTFHFKPFVH